MSVETALSTPNRRTRTRKLRTSKLHTDKFQVTKMHNADLYQQSNNLQKRDALLCLEKHASKIKWKNSNNKIIDIGCGDGSVTNMLKKYLPDNYKLLGCDISESMVNFANNNHCNEQTSFTVLDIGGELPLRMENNFDHVFSFYALHWISDQKRVYRNIYNLLEEDGECFLIYLACSPVFDVYRILARKNKWATKLQDVEKYVSPYHDSTEPDKEIIKIMEEVGFDDIDVECKEMVFEYNDVDMLRKAVTAINPFNIPKEQYGDFLEDYMTVTSEMYRVDKANNNFNITFNYKLLIVYGHKPSNKSY
ncbi:juvenile hormone acid O-methyltransferase-like [Anticarsia gemmatalis]|uniref:juvenile hormone acid O-methyltransferase-like n=1 Tax=Anticarsia gemmatalis TaxID=129554 RepID=UPI003F765C14